jgi:Arc/MetJ-type ribon-helix-helix transcriptional regulator
MSKVELSLPDRIDNDIRRLVDQGEFVNRDQAVEELLSMGMSAYSTTSTDDSQEPEENLFSQAIEDQQDPAARSDTGDDYSF